MTSSSESPLKPIFDDDEVAFAGPVFDARIGTFNAAYRYDAQRQIYMIGNPRQDVSGSKKHMPALVQIQNAVGRLAFSNAAGQVQSFLSGFFVSPKRFVTAAHAMKTPEGVSEAGSHAYHRISVYVIAEARSLEASPESWMSATLLRVDLQLDVAVFELMGSSSVPEGSYFSVADYASPHQVKPGDPIAAIVYNGSVTKLELDAWAAALPENERPPFALDARSAALYLAPDEKALAPGCVVKQEAGNIFAISASLSPGASGGPVFSLKEDRLYLVGIVRAGKVPHNYNVMSSLTKEMIELMM